MTVMKLLWFGEVWWRVLMVPTTKKAEAGESAKRTWATKQTLRKKQKTRRKGGREKQHGMKEAGREGKEEGVGEGKDQEWRERDKERKKKKRGSYSLDMV